MRPRMISNDVVMSLEAPWSEHDSREDIMRWVSLEVDKILCFTKWFGRVGKAAQGGNVDWGMQ